MNVRKQHMLDRGHQSLIEKGIQVTSTKEL